MTAVYLDARRKLQFLILFMLILFSFAAASSGYWQQWAFIASMWGFLIIIDSLFLTDNTFVYDPDYKNWGVRTGNEYASL